MQNDKKEYIRKLIVLEIEKKSGKWKVKMILLIIKLTSQPKRIYLTINKWSSDINNNNKNVLIFTFFTGFLLKQKHVKLKLN